MNYLSATTEFTLGDSMLGVDDIVTLVKSRSLDKAFICDTMNVSAMIPLSDKLGEKLAFGVRFNLVNELLDEKKLDTYQPKVYPLTHNAMQIIYKWLTFSYEKPQFFYVPRLSIDQFIEMLDEAQDEFAVTTGDFNSLLKHTNANGLLSRIMLSQNQTFVELINIKNAVFQRVNSIGKELSKDVGAKLIAFRPSLYLNGYDEAYPIHYSISRNVDFNFLKPYNTDLYYQDSPLDKLNEEFASLPFYQWHKQDPLLPILAADPISTLKAEAIKGFKERINKECYGHKPTMEEVKTVYVERLKYELDTIGSMGFASYFLMVWEVTNWCQRNGILVGPGRGSAGGSLVAYCLKITDVDPIPAGLMFERFINPSRLDLPDIDLDFMSTRRGEIIDHLIDRYGKESVAGIVNYGALQSKSALRSTCRILELPTNEYECTKLIPSQFGITASLEESLAVNELKQFSEKYPKHWEIANKVENRMKFYGTHAAGIVVSERPLHFDAVVEKRGDNRVINWDKKICEKQGLIKLDVLGLTTLDIIDGCIKLIKKNKGVDIDIHSIHLDDKRVLEYFGQGKTGGIFQFEGGSVRRLLRDLTSMQALTFDDLVAANALNRPGPIEAGLVGQYVKGKNGDPVEPPHSSVADIVKDTFNVMVYQEQIQKISMAYSGFTASESDNLRKAIGKKDLKLMAEQKSKFVNGAIEMGRDEEEASKLFDDIENFAKYSFNKSHSYAYSMLGYICMWLKVYHPTEFYAASLSFVGDDKVRPIINEAKKNGIDVLAPDVNVSTDLFEVRDKYTIVAPLSKIKFVASSAVKDILRARADGPFTSYDDLIERTTKRMCNTRVLRALDDVGALDLILGREESEIDAGERSRALNEYLPNVPLGFVAINRKLEMDDTAKSDYVAYIDEIQKRDDVTTIPTMGKQAKFMVIVDSATPSEEKGGAFSRGRAFEHIENIAARSGLTISDGYWTGLIKRTKGKSEKIFSASTLQTAYDDLKREIEIIKPPFILALGTNAVKYFNPTMKGSAFDSAGQIIYNKELDCNIITGFAPGQLMFDPSKEEVLEGLFETLSEML